MKTKIKILVMTVSLTLFMSGNATAQGMPTYDNTNFISLVKQLIESGKQTAQMIKSVKFLREWSRSFLVFGFSIIDFILHFSKRNNVTIAFCFHRDAGNHLFGFQFFRL